MKNEKKLSAAASGTRRKEVIRLRREGMKNSEVSKKVDLSPQTTSTYYAEYEREGKEALKPKVRGRPRGTGKKLTKDQEKEIIFLLLDKDLKFENILWTRESIQELIKQELGIEIPTSTLGDYLREWGLTSIKPIKSSLERKDRVEGSWLAFKFAAIKKEAREEKACIWWTFMSKPLSLSSILYESSPKEKNSKINLMTVITHTGKAKFYLYEGDISMDCLMDFMKQVKNSSDKKVYIIVDNPNLKKRDKNMIRAWDEAHEEESRIFFIPSPKK